MLALMGCFNRRARFDAVVLGVVSLVASGADAASGTGARVASTLPSRAGSVELSVIRMGQVSDCPTQLQFTQWLASQMGPKESSASPLVIKLTIARADKSYAADFSVSGRKQGERNLKAPGPDCRELTQAVAVTLAMLADLDTEALPPPPAIVPPAPEPTPPPTTPPPPVRAFESTKLWVGPAVALTTGFPQSVSAALWLDAGLTFGRFEVSLGGLWTPPRRIDFSPGDVDVQLVGGRAGGCYRFWQSRSGAFESDGCGSVVVGRLKGEGAGFVEDRAQRRMWYSAGPGLEVGGQMSAALGWRLGASAQIPLWRETFSVEGLGKAYEPDFVAVMAAGQLRLKIW